MSTSPVTTIKPHLLSLQCPHVLRDLPGWLTWRLEYHEGEPKPRKVPYYTGGGRRHGVQGRPEDRQQLTTFDAARTAAARRGMDGVGFALMPEWGLVALDFDDCVTSAGIHPDVERMLVGTYCEYSPSGNGVRAFVRGALGNGKSRGGPFGFEVFSSKGFVTFTGNILEVCELTESAQIVADASPEIVAYCTARFGRVDPGPSDPGLAQGPLGLTEAQLTECLDVLPDDLDYDQWLSVGMALHHETGGEGFDLWDEWGAKSPKYSTREYGRYKWDSFGQGGQRPTTAHRLVHMACAHGAHINLASLAADDFAPVVDLGPAQGPASEALRFPVVPAAEFVLRPAPQWIIKQLIPRAELVVLLGAPGDGKTFIAIDLAGCIARGVPWRGLKVRQGKVVYIAAEGAGGFRNRLVAYAQANGLALDALPFGVIHVAPNLLMREDALDVSRSIVAAGGADVVIVDTLARVTPGANENSSEDMGKALDHCKGIHRATGAVVLLVHHLGKDAAKGGRGWSGILGATDTELTVERTPTGRALRTSKHKDGDDGQAWGFDLDVITIGEDADGDPITSCVVREAEIPPAGQVAAARRGLGKWETLVVSAVNELATVQTTGIEVDAVVALVLEREPKADDGKRDTRKQHVLRAVRALSTGGDAPYFLEDGCLSIG